MSALAIALIVFTCVFGSAMLGLKLHSVLPEHHRGADSKDVVKLGTGLLATMAAVVLGLLITSAKESFDKTQEELLQSAAKIVMLDRVLAQYGPETKEIRDLIRRNTAATIETLFSEDAAARTEYDTPETMARMEDVRAKISALSPQNHDQRSLHLRALDINSEVALGRWVLITQNTSISTPFLVVLVLWLTVIFASFGLFAPRNETVIATLFVCALSVSGAIFIVTEMSSPLSGLIQISGAPLRSALAQLGQ